MTVIASKLRGLVAEDGITLTNAFGCYRLDLPEGTWVDLFAAASGAQDAEEALAAGELDQARAAAESAESLARRPFLPGEDGTWVEQKRRDLADIRERALSVLADACLRSGAAREAAKWAEELIALSPFREAGYRRLMEAHVVAGNRAEALRVYEQCRQLLAEELGAYPSPETDSIYRALLEAPQTSVRTTPVAEPTVEPGKSELSRVQTEALPLRAEQVVERRSRKRRAVLLSALTGVIAAAVVVPLVVFGHGGSGGRSAVSAADDSLGVVDARSGRLVADTGVGATPTAVAAGEGAYWVTNADGHTVSRIDPGTTAVVDTIPVGNGPSGIATGAGAVWVVNSLDGTVSRIDPGTNTVVQKIGVGGGPLGIVYAAGSVWVANTGDGTITRIDPESGRPTKTLQVAATELAFGAGTLWASQRAAGQVVRIDPTTGKQVFAPIHVGNGPTGIAFGHGAAWVANSLDGTVSRIDPDTNSVTATVPTGNGPDAVAVDARGIWVSNQFDGNVVRIDPSRNQVAQRVSVGKPPTGTGDVGRRRARRRPSPGRRPSRRDARAALVTAQAGQRHRLHRYRPFRLHVHLSVPADDRRRPHRVQPGQRSGRSAARARPRDVAADADRRRPHVHLPAPPGIRYSNGRPVQATDFRSTFERDYALKSFTLDYDEIVGGAQCRKHPKRCDLSRGIVADDAARTVTFHLVRPDPNFLYKLAAPVRVRAAGGHAAPAGPNARAARDRPLHDRDLPAGKAAQARPQPVLPRVVAGRATGRVPRPHRPPHRRHRGRCDSRRRRRQGRCPLAGPAAHGEAGVEARAPVREPVPLRTEAEHPGALPQHPRPAVQPARRPQGRELRRRPRRGDERLGRDRATPSRRARCCRRTSPAIGRTAPTRPARRSTATGRHPT